MKRILSVALAAGVVALLAGAALAQMGGGPAGGGMGPGMMGPGMMGGGMMGGGMMGSGTMGPGMMGGAAGQTGCPGAAATGSQAAHITEDKAKELAQQYADAYLPGFTVERVLPFTGGHGTMYSVELKGADGQVRTFHINPWGNVMPFGGPWRRSG